MNGEHSNAPAPVTTDERASHTPAPWIAEINDVLGMIVYAKPCQSMIAALNATGAEGAAYDADVERQAANARLIAAAPDLLALAKKLAGECAECEGSGESTVNYPDGTQSSTADPPCPDCADIRKVIAKAEGRAAAEPKRKAYSTTQGGPEYDAP